MSVEKKIVFVDVETTGLPDRDRYGNYVTPRNKAAYDNARLLSLSYMITDDTGNTIMNPKELFVKPYGFTIPEKISALTGITTDNANERGIHLNSVVTEFERDIREHDVTCFISHNVAFDKSIVMNSALRRHWIKDPLLLHMEGEMRYKCTSKLIKSKLGRYMKLSEAVKDILKEEPVGLHTALQDMKYCKKLYFYLEESHN